jgi:heterodisulfide reductase subunit A
MEDDIRIGVFVCDCGSNIAGVVNVPQVVEYARGLAHVAHVDEGKWSCSVDALSAMQEAIKEHDLNRVVIASCTPRTHEPLFKRTVKEAGLNPYLLEFVSIREQVSWVHMNEPEIATEKAKDLVKMGVAKAALLEEGEEIRLPVQKDCLVIGGGVAGMTAALHIADQGFHAYVVEKEPRLGGILNRVSLVSHDRHDTPAADLVRAKVKAVEAHPNITVFVQSEIEQVDGYIGNYKVTVSGNGSPSEEVLDISTILVATGMQEIAPEGLYEYGEDPRVITQLQLEGMLKDAHQAKEGSVRLSPPDSDLPVRDVVMINCVNSKNGSRGCCNIGCPISVKNALALKRFDPGINVHVLYRDLSMVKEEHFLLDAAKAAGVKFIRFPDDRYPELIGKNGQLQIQVYDILLGGEFVLPADLLVLTTAFQGHETVERLKGLLKVSTNPDGFFQEAHVKLGPVDFATDGISLGGCAKSPKSFRESYEEGMAAAMRVSIPMQRGYVETEGIVADIDLT